MPTAPLGSATLTTRLGAEPARRMTFATVLWRTTPGKSPGRGIGLGPKEQLLAAGSLPGSWRHRREPPSLYTKTKVRLPISAARIRVAMDVIQSLLAPSLGSSTKRPSRDRIAQF